ncbi:flagellar export chaperone FlgN [Thermodesulfitimonas sp.]
MERCTRLIGLLEEESVVLKEIIGVAEEEIEAFVNGDHARILKAAARQEELTASLVSLEKERQILQQWLEKELHLPKDCKLSDLLPVLPVEFKRPLAELSQRLQKYASVLLLFQARLYFLIERALTVEETVVRLLSRARSKNDYGVAQREVGLVNQSV